MVLISFPLSLSSLFLSVTSPLLLLLIQLTSEDDEGREYGLEYDDSPTAELGIQMGRGVGGGDVDEM
jgi:hypothetical protein